MAAESSPAEPEGEGGTPVEPPQTPPLTIPPASAIPVQVSVYGQQCSNSPRNFLNISILLENS